MLSYIPPAEASKEQLQALVDSFAAGPPVERRTLLEVAMLLFQGSTLFAVAENKGVILVSVREGSGERRLLIEAIKVRGSFLRGWAAAVRRLAADWKCDTIETVAYCPRLARAILLCGAEQEAVVLKMQVRR